MELQKFDVTVLVTGPGALTAQHVLPVDSPDAEHAVSAAMSNAVAFTPKVHDGVVADISFKAVAVAPRS